MWISNSILIFYVTMIIERQDAANQTAQEKMKLIYLKCCAIRRFWSLCASLWRITVDRHHMRNYRRDYNHICGDDREKSKKNCNHEQTGKVTDRKRRPRNIESKNSAAGANPFWRVVCFCFQPSFTLKHNKQNIFLHSFEFKINKKNTHKINVKLTMNRVNEDCVKRVCGFVFVANRIDCLLRRHEYSCIEVPLCQGISFSSLCAASIKSIHGRRSESIHNQNSIFFSAPRENKR